MLAIERHRRIVSLLDEQGQIRIRALSDLFGVAEETVRRDIRHLEYSHDLQRVHGGVRRTPQVGQDALFHERIHHHRTQKEAICQAALPHLQLGQTYALDSSTTAHTLARLLSDRPYRILTNALPIINLLAKKPAIQTVCMGGEYHAPTQTFVGAGVQSLARFHIDAALISCVGFDPVFGASEAYNQQAGFKEALLASVEKVILLADSSKLGRKSEYAFAPTARISLLITDDGLPPDLADQFRDQGCEVHIATRHPLSP